MAWNMLEFQRIVERTAPGDMRGRYRCDIEYHRRRCKVTLCRIGEKIKPAYISFHAISEVPDAGVLATSICLSIWRAWKKQKDWEDAQLVMFEKEI